MSLSDVAIHGPAYYESFAPPNVGGSYADPIFGSIIKRLSNALGTYDATVAPASRLTWITGEYSTPCPFNCDNSLLLLVHESYFGLYGSSGLYLRDLPLDITASSEPRWSRRNNYTLYYVNGNQLKVFDVVSGAVAIVHTFADYTTISGMGKSDISLDGDHFVFCGAGRAVFVYELSSDRQYKAWENTGSKTFHNLYLTPHNNFSLAWWDHGTVPGTGVELFDINGRYIRQLVHADGHMDYMLDQDGSEVLIWTNSDDPEPVAGAINAIVKVRLQDGRQTPLLSLDWSLAVHVSTPDSAGFCYVETYAPSNPQPQDFKPYTNELLKVSLTGEPVRRLAHHRSRPTVDNTYNWQPRISCSRDGSRFIFASNYKAVIRQGVAQQYSDAYMIQVDSARPPVPGPRPPRPPVPPHPSHR